MIGGLGLGPGMGFAMVLGFVLVVLVGLALLTLLVTATVWLVRDLGRRSWSRRDAVTGAPGPDR